MQTYYTATDWIDALDDTTAYQPPPTTTRPRLRNWQKYVITAALIRTVGSILIHHVATAQGANAATALVIVALALAVQLIADAITLAIAAKLKRL